MKPISKKVLIISISCIAAGTALGVAGFALGGRPGITVTSKGLLSASTLPEPAHMEKQKIDAVSSLEIHLNSDAQIRLLPSGDDSFYLEYTLDQTSGAPQLNTSQGQLTLSQKSNGFTGGLFMFGPFFHSGSAEDPYSVTLYYPEGADFTSVNIVSESGDLSIQGLRAKDADLSADYGDITLSDAFLETLDIQAKDGDIHADKAEITSLNLTNEYGNTKIKNSRITYVDLTVEDGDLYLDGEGLESLEGTNEYGDSVFVLHQNLSDYGFDLKAEYGDIILPSDADGLLHDEDGEEVSYRTKGNLPIVYTSENGDITLRQP